MLGEKNKKDPCPSSRMPPHVMGGYRRSPNTISNSGTQLEAAWSPGQPKQTGESSSLCGAEFSLQIRAFSPDFPSFWGRASCTPPYLLAPAEQLTLLTVCYLSMCSRCLTGDLFFCFFQVKPCVSHWLWLHSPSWALLTHTSAGLGQLIQLLFSFPAGWYRIEGLCLQEELRYK